MVLHLYVKVIWTCHALGSAAVSAPSGTKIIIADGPYFCIKSAYIVTQCLYLRSPEGRWLEYVF